MPEWVIDSDDMKKICLLLLLAICTVSCRIDTMYMPTASRYGLTSLSSDLIMNECYSVSHNFKRLWCAQMYLDDKTEVRDLAWYAREGKCELRGTTITMVNDKYDLGKTIETNGLEFTTPGAEFKVKGYTFTCIDADMWLVEADNFEMIVTASLESLLLMNLDFTVSCTVDSKSGNGVSALIEADYLHKWYYAEDFVYANGFDAFGHAEVTFMKDKTPTDWVKIILKGSWVDAAVTTSRD